MDELCVQPAASDNSVAIGAALAPSLDNEEHARTELCGMLISDLDLTTNDRVGVEDRAWTCQAG